MRFVAVYLTLTVLAPIAVVLGAIVIHILVDLGRGFSEEFSTQRDRGTPLPAAIVRSIGRPLAKFHRDGLNRVRAAEEARSPERGAAIAAHPASGPSGKPQLTLIMGGRR